MNDHLQRALDAMELTAATMSAAELARRTPPQWSAAEIIEHVALAFDGTSKLLGWHLDKGRADAGTRTQQQQQMFAFIIDGGKFPAGLQAPTFAVPKGIAADAALPAFRAAVARLDAAAARCRERFGDRATFGRHAVLGPLTAGEWCRFHWVHTTHHLKQIEARKHAADISPRRSDRSHV